MSELSHAEKRRPPLQSILVPNSTITPEFEKEILGTTFNEIELTPDVFDIDALNVGLISHAFKIVGQRIDDGLRDDNKELIGFLLDSIGVRLGGILEQARETKTEYLQEHTHGAIAKLLNPSLRKHENREKTKVKKMEEAGRLLDELVNGLREKLKASFLLEAEGADEKSKMAIFLIPVLQDLVREIGEFFKYRQYLISKGDEDWHLDNNRFGMSAVLGGMNTLGVTLNQLDVPEKDDRIERIVSKEVVGSLRTARNYWRQGDVLAEVQRLADGLVRDLQRHIDQYQTARMAEFRRGIGA